MAILSTGYASLIILTRVLWIAPFQGQALKKLKKAREAEGKLADLTFGHAAASVIALDEGTLVLSAVSAEALRRRLNKPLKEEEQ